MPELTKNQLVKGLSSTDKYNKYTEPFLEKIYKNKVNGLEAIISEALIEVLKGEKFSTMAKLQVLRFVKDIILTGNIKLVLSLDPVIEDNIHKASIYNIKSKTDKRGENYFI